MIITCPSCATRYSLDETNIPDGGRQVRCAQCTHVWHQDQGEPNDLLSLDQDTQGATGDAVPQLESKPEAEPEAEPEPESDSFEIEIEETEEAESVGDSEPSEEPEPAEEGEEGEEPKAPDDIDSPEETDDLDAADALEEPDAGAEDKDKDSSEDGEADDTEDAGDAEDEGDGDTADDAEDEDGTEDGDEDEEGADIQEARIAEWRATRARERAAGAAEPKSEPRRSDKRGWIVLVVVVATVIGAAAGFREQISSAWPPSQRLYDMIDGLFAPGEPEAQEAEEPEPEEPAEAPKEIAIDVTSSRVAVIDGQRVLLIEGMITNASQSDLTVPAMHGALLDGNGEALHEWTFSVPFASIKAGTQREFETRVVEPPSGARVMKLDPLINY